MTWSDIRSVENDVRRWKFESELKTSLVLFLEPEKSRFVTLIVS